MKIDTLRCGNFLGVYIQVFNPASDAAEDPAVATATFYQITAAGLIMHPDLAVIALVQVVPGIWGGQVDATDVDLQRVVVIVQATVGGVGRSVMAVLGIGGSVKRISVGGPQITVTAGPVVDEAKGN